MQTARAGSGSRFILLRSALAAAMLAALCPLLQAQTPNANSAGPNSTEPNSTDPGNSGAVAPTSNTNNDASKPLPIDEVRIFAQVLNQVREAYVEPIDDKTLLENAIKGMLAGIDPHSSYLADEAYSDLQETTTGEFGGLGVEVGIENGFIRIIAPIDDSPAARAGIQAGDLIIKLDDTPAQQVTEGDSSELLRGAPGTSIRLTIMREGRTEPFEVTIVREIIKARSIRSRELEAGYGYIRIAQFSGKTGDEVVEALSKLQGENNALKGLVLDLRNNPGGVLQAGVATVDAFITEGLIVYTQGRVANSNMRFEATPDDPSHGVPLVVLINGGSASAAEIVAGALQDSKRAILMGTRSFGKGSVQSVLPVSEDRAIKLTTSLYFTPNGRSIQATGIVPDIIVDRGQVTKIADSVTAYREEDLSRHLSNANTDIKITSPANTKTPSPPASSTSQPKGDDVLVDDYQLNEALNLLKGLSIFKSQ
jgi:carboxyl-terminal processing protease